MTYSVASGFLYTPTDVQIIFVLRVKHFDRSKSLVTELSGASCYFGCLINLIFTSRNI
jgi:hypothetical protein